MVVVVGAKLEDAQQLDQPGAVVVGVGGAKHLALVALVGLGACLVLVDEVGQALHAAGDRVDHVLDLPAGARERDLGDAVQHRVLVAHALELLDDLLGDLAVSVGVDLVHRRVQEFHDRVGDLALAQMQQRGEQDQADRLVVAGEVAGRLDRGPRPPRGDDVRGDPVKQPRWQADMADRVQLADLGQHRRQAHTRTTRPRRVVVGL